MKGLKGKVVIVTGGAAGIGATFCHRLQACRRPRSLGRIAIG